MNKPPELTAEPPRTGWLQSAASEECRTRIWELGLLTGLRADEQGNFTPANFERALVLDRLIQLHKPAQILEIGTGRGLGSMSMAASARQHGVTTQITTLDILTADFPQRWPIQIAGQGKVLQASRQEIWGQHLDKNLTSLVTEVIGPTTRTMPQLVREGRKFDLIFIDAGHDLYSVVHDLAYSIQLLQPGGVILMDDFAPMEEFGLGTCVVVQQARRFFKKVEIFPTEGLIFGGTEHSEAPRGMVLLSEPVSPGIQISQGRLLLWRIAEFVLRLCHAPQFFPVRSAPAAQA